MKHLTPSLSVAVAASLLLTAGNAFAEEPIGEQATEKYKGFAEENPDLVDDRGSRLQKEGDQVVEDQSAAGDSSASEVYPEEVVEGNDPLTPGVENQPAPHSDEADVHGDFGDQNPDIQR